MDRLTATAYELVIDGQSYRRRQRPQQADTDQDNARVEDSPSAREHADADGAS